MKKPLNAKPHGMLDYLLTLAFLLAPGVFGFSETAATACYVFGSLLFGVSILTAYPLGLIKLIPFPIHGALEFIMSIVVIASPWMLGFPAENSAKAFCV